MNLKNTIKVYLFLISILLLTTVMPITYANDTLSQGNNQEFQATHAELVNFIMYLQQTLSDFDDYSFDEELLENLQVEIEQALIMTQRSTVVATVEYSLGFLRVAYSSLLEDAIKNEIDANQLLLKELGELTKENVTSPSWSVLQKQLERSTGAVQGILLELDQLGIKLNNDSDEKKELDENFEVFVIDLPDLTSELREIFDTLIKIRQALVSTHHTLQ